MDKDWLKSYQTFVFTNVTVLAVPETSKDSLEIRKQMVSQSAMKIWIRMVTHSSFEPNNDSNYDPLEKFGDSIIKTTFESIVLPFYPNIDAQSLTNLEAAQLWRGQQSKLSDEIGLSKYLRSIVIINEHIREDLLEAMFGAIFFVGEEIIGHGNGFMMCYNATRNLYEDTIKKIDFSLYSKTVISKNPKQELKEIGDKLGWYSGKPSVKEFGSPVQVKNKFGEVIYNEVTYTLPLNAITWLQANGYKILNDGFLASARTKESKDIENEIAIKTLQILKRDYNIDYEFASYGKKKAFPTSVENKMKQDNIIDINIIKDKYSEHYQLIGNDSDNRRYILLTVINETRGTAQNVKNEIIALYGNEGKQPKGNIIKLK